MFLQCVLFHWLVCHSLPISSLWHNPSHFWATYLPKLSISLLFAAPVFLFRRKYWTIVVSALISIFALVELVYYRSTHIFLDAYSFQLLHHLHGFESSIGMYLAPDLLLLLLPVCLTALAVFLFGNSQRQPSMFVVAFFGGWVMSVGAANLVARQNDNHSFYGSSFSSRFVGELFFFNTNTAYLHSTSFLHSLVFNSKQAVFHIFERPFLRGEIDEEAVRPFLDSVSPSSPTHPLILILVESLETWAVRPDITPNLWQFVQSHNVVFAPYAKSQTKAGNSADGQMIYNTGVLPIAEGAVAVRYSHNAFPSLSDVYASTAMVQPGSLSSWNQYDMNRVYHIDTAYVISSSLDDDVFRTLDSIATGQYDYILAITMASHSPFKACSHYSSLSLPEDMPANMRNYLLCLNYTDSCWGSFLQRIDTDSVLHNSVVCFMGDHIIFDPIMRGEFQDYCDKKGLDFQPREAYTAFVAYSPDLQTSTLVTEPTYQMDAYPTILHLIGAEDYYWRGFGVNLTDTAALHHRPITEQEAYMLSDKLIRANYFKDYVNRAE